MKTIFFIAIILMTQAIYAQTKLPIIRAESVHAFIQDGKGFGKSKWTLSPETKPDVYIADRTRKTKWVIFYTDLDSIKIKVKPGTNFNFIVLLNDKDSCFTQVKSAIPNETSTPKNKFSQDTIPFVLTAYNAIHVKSIINDSDTLNLHFDVGSFDFRLTKDAIQKKTKLLANQPDAILGKAKPNYNKLEKVYKIKLGSLVFVNPEIVATGLTAHDMDGRFGWNIFEGKVVEIDFDNSLLIVYTTLPKKAKKFAKSSINFLQSFVCVKGIFEIENKKYEGDFIFDTGSDQVIILDSIWAVNNHFPQDLKLLKTLTFSDPRGVKYETKVVLTPSIKVNGFAIHNIPASLLGLNNPVGFEVNYFGNDFIKRFNVLLDFKNDNIYLKPNSLVNFPYKTL